MKFIGYCIYDSFSGNQVGYSQIHYPFTHSWKKGVSILSLDVNENLIVHNHWVKIFQRKFKKYFRHKYLNLKAIINRQIYGKFNLTKN